MAAINSKELDLLSQFRQRFRPSELSQDQSSNLFLISWIRARGGDLVKAEAMLQAYLKIRADNDLENILSWEPPEEFKEHFFIEILGYDAENSPVCAAHLGRIKYKKIIENGQQDEFVKYFDFLWQQAHDGMKGKLKPDGVTPVSQLVIIADMAKFPYMLLANKGVMDLMVKISKRFESTQPETLKKDYIINAGRVFPTVYSIIKPIMDPATADKISIYGGPSKWKPILIKNIPANVLPPAYGGTNTSSKYGQKVADALSLVEDDVEIESIYVMLEAADKFSMAFEVREKGSTFSWAFNTSKSGVGIVVSRGSKVYFDSKGHVNSHVKQIEGSITCDKSGDYTLTFDNTKNGEEQELKYRVDIRSASGAIQLEID